MSALWQWLKRVVHDDNLDLYLLVVVALIFTVLGFTGVASSIMSSVTVGTLAVLAFSQIRSRSHVAQIATFQRVDPLAVLRTRFPEDLDSRRSAATDLLYIGVSMFRTLPTVRDDIRRMALAGHRVRVVLVDPTDEQLISGAAMHLMDVSPVELAARVTNTLNELMALGRDTSRPIEVRVAPIAPTMNMNVIDQQAADGLIVLQHYDFQPTDVAGPILRLTTHDGYWFRHYSSEAERIWESSAPWPLSSSDRAARYPRPRFRLRFGEDLYDNIERAHELLITGVTRRTLFNENYTRFDRCLRHGGRLRVVLVDPASDALAVAADRYQISSARRTDHAGSSVAHVLDLLGDLRRDTGALVEARLTRYPLGVGMIGIDDEIAYVEYYTYRAPGEPKFVLGSHDEPAYRVFRNEAEELWTNARPIELDGTLLRPSNAPRTPPARRPSS